MDVIKCDFKETICENVQLLDWLMDRAIGSGPREMDKQHYSYIKFAEISDRPNDSKIKEDTDPSNDFKVKMVI
jgi:hypothetical protein